MSRTDKEARLKDFISEAFVPRGEEPAREVCLTLFVRSPDSPAARALYAAWSEGLIEGAQILVVAGDTTVEEPSAPSVFGIPGIECRVLGDSSFGPAHEQLTLSHSRVWIGDCLRRDPTKRDAFELYHPNDASICVFAIASFKKLWDRSRPLKHSATGQLSPEIIAARSDDPNALPRNPRH
ncbi:MAG: hypothetical protein QM780_17040 [Hyphomicrobium sp.]|uniref:hypothetical protein n=1 Tax=Hyphomicrobium sp. TaxID=82 RepID=UPI0039E4E160